MIQTAAALGLLQKTPDRAASAAEWWLSHPIFYARSFLDPWISSLGQSCQFVDDGDRRPDSSDGVISWSEFSHQHFSALDFIRTWETGPGTRHVQHEGLFGVGCTWRGASRAPPPQSL